MGHALDRANHIIQSTLSTKKPSKAEGEQIVSILLDGRDITDLDVEELCAIAKGYNWCSNHREASQAMHLAVAKQPHDLDLLTQAVRYMGNIPYQTALCELSDSYIRQNIGPAWFWHLQKVGSYLLAATGEDGDPDYEWVPGHPLAHPDALELAIQELITVLRSGEAEAIHEVKLSVYEDDTDLLRESPRFDELLALLNAVEAGDRHDSGDAI
jgi:hypothetical protein